MATAAYMRMEYCEADECFASGQAKEGAAQESTAAYGEPQPEPNDILAARLEEERRAITAQSRTEIEREVRRARAAVAEAIEQFAKQRDSYFRQVESEVVQLALGIARRIVHRESQVDPQLIAALVRHELEQLDEGTSVRLVVTPDALDHWSEAASAMSRSVEVTVDRAIAPGTLRMETAMGSTSINFEAELKEIERGFFDLLSHRPAVEETRTARLQ
jgi:flagellar assembly protein FliH